MAPKPLPEDRIKVLRKIIDVLQRPGVNPAGAAALEAYVNNADVPPPFDVRWLHGEGLAHGPIVVTGNRYFPQLPDVSYPLLAKFH